MSKAHLTVSEVPIHDGFPVETICRLEISPCQIVFLWDSLAMNAPLAFSTLLCCKKCAELIAEYANEHDCEDARYIYGVIRAEHVPDEETQELETAA